MNLNASVAPFVCHLARWMQSWVRPVTCTLYWLSTAPDVHCVSRHALSIASSPNLSQSRAHRLNFCPRMLIVSVADNVMWPVQPTSPPKHYLCISTLRTWHKQMKPICRAVSNAVYVTARVRQIFRWLQYFAPPKVEAAASAKKRFARVNSKPGSNGIFRERKNVQ